MMHGQFVPAEIYLVEPCHLWKPKVFPQLSSIKVLRNLHLEQGTFCIFSHLCMAFFRPFLADFLNSSFSAIYGRSMSTDAHFSCSIFDA